MRIGGSVCCEREVTRGTPRSAAATRAVNADRAPRPESNAASAAASAANPRAAACAAVGASTAMQSPGRFSATRPAKAGSVSRAWYRYLREPAHGNGPITISGGASALPAGAAGDSDDAVEAPASHVRIACRAASAASWSAGRSSVMMRFPAAARFVGGSASAASASAAAGASAVPASSSAAAARVWAARTEARAWLTQRVCVARRRRSSAASTTGTPRLILVETESNSSRDVLSRGGRKSARAAGEEGGGGFTIR
jgi:hypothetical protein